jgi:hypothetical protein
VVAVVVDAGPVRWWWAGPVVGMTRRRGVGRLPARLMFAGWDRRSAVRRKVPLTSHAPAAGWWHRTGGDRPCSGGAPTRHGGHDHHGADGRPLGMLGRRVPLQRPRQLGPKVAAGQRARPLQVRLPQIGAHQQLDGLQARAGAPGGPAGLAHQDREQALDLSEWPLWRAAEGAMRPHSAPARLELPFDHRTTSALGAQPGDLNANSAPSGAVPAV